MHVLYTATFFDVSIRSTGISYGGFCDEANVFRPEYEGQIPPLFSRARRLDIMICAPAIKPTLKYVPKATGPLNHESKRDAEYLDLLDRIRWFVGRFSHKHRVISFGITTTPADTEYSGPYTEHGYGLVRPFCKLRGIRFACIEIESGPADLEFQSEYEACVTEVCQSTRSPAPSAPPPAVTIHFPGFWELMELARALINDSFYPEVH